MYQEEKKKKLVFLIGNKGDEERKISYEDAEKFAKQFKLKYIETSAKLDKGIKKALIYLLDQIIESMTLYNSISSVETNDKFLLDSKTFKEESFWEKFCKKYSSIFKKNSRKNYLFQTKNKIK